MEVQLFLKLSLWLSPSSLCPVGDCWVAYPLIVKFLSHLQEVKSNPHTHPYNCTISNSLKTLVNWPQFSTPPGHMIFQCDFDDSTNQDVKFISPSLNLGWSGDLIWPIQCSRSKDEPFPSPDLKRPCTLVLALCHCLVNKPSLVCWGKRDNMEQNWVSWLIPDSWRIPDKISRTDLLTQRMPTHA